MIRVLLAAYSLTIAVIWGLVYTASPDLANTLVMAFVVAALLPAFCHDLMRRNR